MTADASHPAATHDILDFADRIVDAGGSVVLATVIETWGSSPRAVGAHLAVAEAGGFAGSISGGCIESAAITAAETVMKRGRLELLEVGVSNERAWEVGLTCGGKITVLLEPYRAGPVRALLARARAAGATAIRLVDLDSGADHVVTEDEQAGDPVLDEATLEIAREAMGSGRSGMLPAASTRLFGRLYTPPLRLIIVGAVHIAQALAPMARLAGYAVTVVDPRRAFATRERFPDTALSTEWPERAFDTLRLDSGCAVVTLGHQPDLDDEALILALRSPAHYIGALGSKRTHAKRLTRLRKQCPESLLAKIHAPIGLPLGGREPAQIAVSILAQMIGVRHGG